MAGQVRRAVDVVPARSSANARPGSPADPESVLRRSFPPTLIDVEAITRRSRSIACASFLGLILRIEPLLRDVRGRARACGQHEREKVGRTATGRALRAHVRNCSTPCRGPWRANGAQCCRGHDHPLRQVRAEPFGGEGRAFPLQRVRGKLESTLPCLPVIQLVRRFSFCGRFQLHESMH